MLYVDGLREARASVQAEVERLLARRDLLDELIAEAESRTQPAPPRRTGPFVREGSSGRSRVVLDYVLAHPGCTGTEVVDVVLATPGSEGQPRKNVHSLISTLVRRGKMQREGERLYVVE